MTVTSRPGGQLRLPSPPPPRTQRRRELRTGILGALGLLAVLVGVPAALLWAVGNPLPTTAPSRDWLVADVSATTVIRVLAVVLWIAWAHFVVCVLSEWRAARRGRGLPGEVPLGGGSQLMARRLVAAALLLAGAATLAPAPGPAEPVRPTSISSSVVAQAPETAAPAAPQAAGSTATQSEASLKAYTVQPPDGRRYDSLWDIAERTLGDPFRYREVFELNRDRQQDDGRVLVDADLIQPGWVLRLPADASGPGVTTPALTPAPATPAPVSPAPGTPSVDAGVAAVVDMAAPQADQAPSGLDASRLLLGGGLLAAGLLSALTARRGPYGRPSEDPVEQQLRLAADPGRVRLLDHGLRSLAASRAAQGTALPEVVLATCDDSQLVLSLVGTAPEPPAPWRVVADGRGWALSAADLPDEPAPDVAAPYPGLAGLAVLSGTDILVDLEAAPGLVALGGDRLAARETAMSLVVELATNTWSDGVELTVVGFGEDLAGAGSVTSVDRLADVLGALESQARNTQDVLRSLGADDVLSGRLVRAADRHRLQVVVLSGPPTPEEAARVSDLVRGGRTPLAFVCVGDTPAARWRFVVDAEGTIDLGVLSVRAQARRLGRTQLLRLQELLRGATGERTGQGQIVAALTPRSAFEETSPRAAPPRLPHLPAAVEVRVLGPVTVVAPGPVEAAARPLLTELVVAVALQREGVHEAALRAQVWPRGVGDDVLAATMAQAQTWLGRTGTGTPRLSRAADGRWTLAEDVHGDVDLLHAVAAAPAGGADEQALLQRALAQVRGEAFSAGPAQRYGWLVFHRAARDARVVGTAVARRSAALAQSRGNGPAARDALRTGLELVPTAEPLWRDLLRLTAQTDPSSAPDVAEQLYAALGSRGLPAEPETDALVQQLVPGHSRTA